LKSADSDPNHEISILVPELWQEEKNNSNRSGNNHCTQQSKQPNVNISSEATSTCSLNENISMHANHSRNQNRKAAKVLTKND